MNGKSKIDKKIINKLLDEDIDEILKDLKKISNEETLYNFALRFNWYIGEPYEIASAILKHPCCTLSVALKLFYYGECIFCLFGEDRYFGDEDDIVGTNFTKNLYYDIINGKYKKGRVAFKADLTKVEKYKLRKYCNLQPEEEVFINDIPGEDCDVWF